MQAESELGAVWPYYALTGRRKATRRTPASSFGSVSVGPGEPREVRSVQAATPGPDNVSALGWPHLLISLYAPVAALIGGCLAWVILAFSQTAVAALRGRWLGRTVVVVQIALLAAAWLLFSTAPRSGSEGCVEFTNVWWLVIGVLLAACGAGAVAIARAFALEGDAGQRRLGLVVLGLVMPYATTLVLMQDAFCGWN